MPMQQRSEQQTYIGSGTAAALMDTSKRSIQRQVKDKVIPVATRQGPGGAGGVSYLIDTRDLPIEAQLRFYAMNEGGDAEADLAGYRIKKGEKALEELMQKLDRKSYPCHGQNEGESILRHAHDVVH